jgi:hypothetical protein
MFQILLKYQALSYFEHYLRKKVEAEDSDVPDNELIELVLRDVGLEYIPYARHMRAKALDPERSLWPSLFFLKKLMHLKGN